MYKMMHDICGSDAVKEFSQIEDYGDLALNLSMRFPEDPYMVTELPRSQYLKKVELGRFTMLFSEKKEIIFLYKDIGFDALHGLALNALSEGNLNSLKELESDLDFLANNHF